MTYVSVMDARDEDGDIVQKSYQTESPIEMMRKIIDKANRPRVKGCKTVFSLTEKDNGDIIITAEYVNSKDCRWAFLSTS